MTSAPGQGPTEPGPPRGDDPPGVARERTYIAWQRTGLAFAAVGVLFLHVGHGPWRPLHAVPGLFGLAAGAVVVALGALRYRPALGAPRSGRRIHPPVAILTVACLAVLLGTGGLAIVALG